jgi:hypothetical protein
LARLVALLLPLLTLLPEAVDFLARLLGLLLLLLLSRTNRSSFGADEMRVDKAVERVKLSNSLVTSLSRASERDLFTILVSKKGLIKPQSFKIALVSSRS